MATANETRTPAPPGSLGRQPPDDDNKSTVHSGRLIYAKPQDLPSFPSIGLSQNGSAASAAAALGWTTNTSPVLWKPDKSASASAAAIMAKDYKMSPMWKHVPSEHSSRAALLASQSAMSPRIASPAVTDSGFSAANMAFRSDRDGSAARTPNTHSLERQKSLLAAKGAMANRQRAKSSPFPSKESYPDEANATANALSAATRAHRPVQSPTASEIAGSIPYTNMNRQMFTSHPPVKSEVDEQKRADVLHASAVAMAKKMYTQQQKMIDARKAHENAAALALEHADAHSSVSDDAQPVQLTTLQDAAYKQAQARLARMHEEHFKNREYHEYYGAKHPARRFSIRGKLRRRASSDGDVIEDRRRSVQIRRQMSMFSNKLSEIDDKKRQQDQGALLAAAQRNVHERLKVMDKRISAETGMVPPSTMTQWELKAHATAQARSDQRVGQGHGKIDVGAGMFMDQEDIDAIAAARVKPILDDINEKVEEEQARQTEYRLEMEKKKEEEEIEKTRQKEIDEINKKLKEQDKQERKEKKAEEKQEVKAKKEEDRAAKAEHKRLAKVGKRKSSADRPTENHEEPETVMGTIALNTAGQPVSIPPPEANAIDREAIGTESAARQPESPEGPSKSGVKTWLKNRFSRGSKSADDGDKPAKKSFVGGAALAGVDSSASLDNHSASMRAVAMAGRPQDEEAVSPISTESEDEYFRDEARYRDRDSDRDQPGTALTPTPPRPAKEFPSAVSQSPSRDSRFRELV